MFDILRSDLYVRNIQELKGQELCPFLKEMDRKEKEIQDAEDEEHIKKVSKLGPRIGVGVLAGVIVTYIAGTISLITYAIRDAERNNESSTPYVATPLAVGGGSAVAAGIAYPFLVSNTGDPQTKADRLQAKINAISFEILKNASNYDPKGLPLHQLKVTRIFFQRRLNQYDNQIKVDVY